MHIHILGICGTFMGGVAALARAAGHEVTGSDSNVYPPMSTQLEALGIRLGEGYDPARLEAPPDCVIVGNALSRGNPELEHVLDAGMKYTSGPQWLAENVLHGRHVVAVAGTHGKTTTASMLAWILEVAERAPGFLVGGVPVDFDVSARLGGAAPFVVEADEYDTAFFDKRSKLVHYRPRTAVLNNLEFDHADIFHDLAAIERQFHHFVRTIPSRGRILCNGSDVNLARVLQMGCWTPVEYFGGAGSRWRARLLRSDGSAFEVIRRGRVTGRVQWDLLGRHNVDNALAALAAAEHAGVGAAEACAALDRFRGVRRRLELRGEAGGIAVFDDFAHHPTAIASTLAGMRQRAGGARIVALIEPRSNTMRMGVHREALASSLADADRVFLLRPADLAWDLDDVARELDGRATVCADVDAMLAAALPELRPGDRVVAMSNGDFGDIHQRLLDALAERAGP